jgi:type IV pilus assembly protein PilP
MAGVATLALLAACSDDAPPAAAPAPPAKAGGATAAAAGADAGVAVAEAAADAGTAAYVYAYNPLGRRDPFRVYAANPTASEGMATGPGCNDPLCQYDLEQLNLVAIVTGDANPIAMVEDPGRVGHIIRRNSQMGRQGGRVTQILRDCVIVTEYFQDPSGKSHANPLKMCIGKTDGLAESAAAAATAATSNLLPGRMP